MGDVDQGELERADLVGSPTSIVRRSASTPNSSIRPCGESEGHGCAINRDVDVAEEIGKGTDVVFVAVGQNDAITSAVRSDQPAPIGKDEVDPEHLLLGEHEPAIDQQRALPSISMAGGIAPDVAEAAEERDLDVMIGCHDWPSKLAVTSASRASLIARNRRVGGRHQRQTGKTDRLPERVQGGLDRARVGLEEAGEVRAAAIVGADRGLARMSPWAAAATIAATASPARWEITETTPTAPTAIIGHV